MRHSFNAAFTAAIRVATLFILSAAYAVPATAVADTKTSPILSVGCRARPELQARVFNKEDQDRVDRGQIVRGKVAVRDQFYSVTTTGPVDLPSRTTIAVEYDGVRYGPYGYIIETGADAVESCVQNIIANPRVSGKSSIPSLVRYGDNVVLEGALPDAPESVISVIMIGSSGNTFISRSDGTTNPLMSHNRQKPSNFEALGR